MSTTTLGYQQTLDNGTITIGATDLELNGYIIYLEGSLANAGTFSLASTNNFTDLVLQSAVVSLTGGGALLLSDSPYNRIYGGGTGLGALINVNNTIAGAGDIGLNASGASIALTNEAGGVIDASANVNALVIQTGGPAVVNDGLLEATGSGGLLIYQTTIDQTGGGTILASGPGDVFIQPNADILGGLLLGTLGGEIIFNGGGQATLGGPSTAAALTIGTATTVQVDNQQLLELYGTLDNLGTLFDDSTGSLTDIVVESPVVTLTGSGTLLLSDNANNRVYGGGPGLGGLVNINNTIAGAGQLGVNNGGLALTITNEKAGVIDATGTANALVIQTGAPTLVNSGLIEATGSGGLIINNSIIDQTGGGTVLASGPGNIYLQQNADILNGLLLDTLGGEIILNGGGQQTLGGPSTSEALTIGTATTVQVNNQQLLELYGTLDNLGTLFDDSNGNATDIVLESAIVSLTGGGTLLLSDSPANRIYGGGAGLGALININNTIAGAGQLGLNDGNLSLAVTNDGIIDATGVNALVIQTGGAALINNKLLEATGSGGLSIDSTKIVNSFGTILAGGGIVNLSFADIVGGTVIATSGGLFVDDQGTTLDATTTALTIAANTTFQENNNQYLDIGGTLDNFGTLFEDSTGNGTDIVLNSPTVDLTGSGTVLLSNNFANAIYGGASSFGTLINLNNTIEGAGQLGVNSTNNPLALTNDAVIDANQSGGMQIATGGPALINNKLVEATGAGSLNIFFTTIANSLGTILAGGATVNLTGADIIGGTLIATSGGLFVDDQGTTLDATTTALTIAANTTFQENNNQYLYIGGTLDNFGTLFEDSTGNGTDIVLNSPTVDLTGSGTVLLSNNFANAIYGGASSFGTLINLNNTIEGAGQLGVNSTNNPLALTNDAVIDANQSGGMQIATGGPALINNKLVEATGAGSLNIFFTTIANSLGTILAGGATVNLTGADIIGGTLIATSGGLFVDDQGTTLDATTTALTIAANTTFQENNNQYLYIGGTLDNFGTLFEDSTGNGTDIVLNSPTVDLTGSGTVLLSDQSANAIYGGAVSLATLVNLNNTIEGAGQIGISSANNPLTLINDGVIDANENNGTGLVIQTGGPAVTNAGLMEATNGGHLVIAGATAITNTSTGTIAAFDSSFVEFQNGYLVNDAGGMLTGGEYAAYAVSGTSYLELSGAGGLSVDAADIILSGSSSDIYISNFTTNLNSFSPIESSLTEVSGTLQIDNNKTFSSSNILTIDIGGHLDLAAGTLVPAGLSNAGTIFGNGVIGNPAPETTPNTIINIGEIEAHGGTLTAVSGYISGSGSIVIDSGAAFEMGSIIGEPILRESVVFAPGVASLGTLTGDKLIIDGSPYGFQGVLTSLAPGDTIDLAGAVATSATIIGTTLVVSLGSAGTVDYSLASANALDRAVTSPDGAGGTDITFYGDAVAGTLQPLATNFGDRHVGAVVSEALTLANIGAVNQYAENLDATMVAASTGLISSGSFTALAAGATNSTSLTAGLNTSTAGVKSGTATVALFTDGALVASDGLGPLAIGTQSVSLTGTIFNYATGSISPVPLALGEHHVADVVSGFVTLANNAAAGIYSENLDANFSGTSADLTALGGVSALAAGSLSSAALALTLHSGTAGIQTGTAAISLISDGSGIDTLGTTSLGTVTETVTGTLYNFATVAASAVSLGEAHVAGTLTKTLTISNNAASGAFSEGLDASISGTSTDLTGFGSLTTLAAGASNSSALSVTLSGAAAGAYTGAATIAVKSDGAGIDTLASTALAAQTVAVTGMLFNEATASAIAPVNFGIVHVGTTAGTFITLSNSAASGAYSETLDARFTGTTGSITAGGTLNTLAAGATSTSTLSIALDTAAAGTIIGAATLGLISDGAGIDTLGTTSLGADTIAVTGTVNNYATAAMASVSGTGTLTGGGTSYLLAFGNVHSGTTHAETIQILNGATGPADLLSGSFSVVSTAAEFSNLGFNSFTSIAAGAAETGLTIDFGGTTLGQQSETIVLDPTGFNASGYAGTLAPETLVITGDIMPCFAAGTRILGMTGERPVEDIRVGDRLVTLRENGPNSRRVIWTGKRSLDVTRHPSPAEVQPVRIAAGAFAPGVPERDLRLSPRHAVYVDGLFFEAISLINGITIWQEAVGHVTYHHIELEAHDVLLAEGLPAESFLDTGNKNMFECGPPMMLHPFFDAHGDDGFCAPIVRDGQRLTALRERLSARAAAARRHAA